MIKLEPLLKKQAGPSFEFETNAQKETARCRFIVFAAHTKEDLNKSLAKIDKCAKELAVI